MTNRRLDKALRKSNKKKEDKVILLSGELGIPLNGQKLVEVPNRKGFVFVRLKNNTSELIQAYNTSVSPIYDLPVLVARQVGGYKIVGRNIDRYSNQWGNAPYLPKHGPQHSFNPSLNIGGDVVWVYSQQIMPLLGYPSGSSGSPQLAISPYIVRDLNGNWKYIGNTGTPDTTPYNPTTGSRATMVLVYLDTVSGNPALLVNSGTYMDGSLTGSSDVAQYIPRVTNPNWIPSVAIRLVSGTSVLTWNNLYDVRPFLQVVPTGSSSGGGGTSILLGVMTQDEGIPLGTGTTLNFVGAGVTATISGSVVNVNIPGGGGGASGLGFVGWDEGIYQATGTILNVTGQRLTLTASGTVLNLNASPDPYDNIGIYVLATGTPLGTGTWINFGNNLTASISGTVIQLDASASGGSGGAPTTAKYVTTADDGTLTSEVVIPGLAGSPDIKGNLPTGTAGVSEEFDTSSDPFTWDTNPAIFTSNTTIKSHYFIKDINNTARYNQIAWSPAGAFDIRCKLSVGSESSASSAVDIQFNITDSTRDNRILIDFFSSGSRNFSIAAYTFASATYTQRGSTWTVSSNVMYFRMVRDGSNNVSFYFSSDGLLWQLIATQSFTFTASYKGFNITQANVTSYYAIDWIRSDV